MVWLYHERQVAALCGQHCLNNLCQGPYFSEIDLSEIAQELDRNEMNLMLAEGMTAEARAFMKQDSGNVSLDGNFSIQVLSAALQRQFGVDLEDHRRPENMNYMVRPETQEGFVLNRDSHWYCLRRIDAQWWECNSTQPAPVKLSDRSLASHLAELVANKWTIFLCKGNKLPKPTPKGAMGDPKNWVDPANPPEGERPFGNAATKPEPPKFHAFTGHGQTLGGGGAARPAAGEGLTEEEQLAMALSLSSELAAKQRTPSEPLTLVESEPTPALQVRMTDGSRKVVKANHTHTVLQLKKHIATLAPGVAFSLKGGFPPKPLADDLDALTLADAKLLGESLVFCPS